MTISPNHPSKTASRAADPAPTGSIQRPLGVAIIVVALLMFVAALLNDVSGGLVGSGGATAAMVVVIAIVAGLVYAVARTPKA